MLHIKPKYKEEVHQTYIHTYLNVIFYSEQLITMAKFYGGHSTMGVTLLWGSPYYLKPGSNPPAAVSKPGQFFSLHVASVQPVV